MLYHYGTVGHSVPAAYATRDDALAVIHALPFAPTLLVDTGGGFHAWYALNADAPQDKWREAIGRLAFALNADPNALDEPRILRVAGTCNFKVDPPRPVTLVATSANAYSLSEFLALPARPAAPESRSGPPAASRPFDRANDIPI